MSLNNLGPNSDLYERAVKLLKQGLSPGVISQRLGCSLGSAQGYRRKWASGAVVEIGRPRHVEWWDMVE